MVPGYGLIDRLSIRFALWLTHDRVIGRGRVRL